MELARELYLDEMVQVDSNDDEEEIEYKMFSSSSEDEYIHENKYLLYLLNYILNKT